MKVEVAHRCAAPPQRVWEWVADPHKHIQMLPQSIKSARVLEDGDIEAELHAAGHRERMVVRIVSADPPRRLEEERVDGVRAGRTVFTLEPDGDGCKVTIHSEVDLPRMIAAVAKPKVVTSLREQLQNLDRLSSSGEM
jgi:carbon monoxide dehydrogenase subunit G